MLKFIEAVLLLSGMIIGAGMFGIPFSFARSGFWLGAVELMALGGVFVAIHLLYGEIVLKTPTRHRLPGYVRIYMGKRPALLAWGSALFGIIGALLAYIVVGSTFLEAIAPRLLPGGEFAWAALFAAGGAAVTSVTLRKEALVNGILTALLILFILGLSFAFLPRVAPAHLGGVRVSQVFIPYGVLLFSLAGATAVPEVVALLDARRAAARRAIAIGSLVPVAIYFLFALALVGTLGTAVSPEAIQGLRAAAGERIVQIGSIIGFLAVFTSFVVLSIDLQALLRLDAGVPRRLVKLLAIGIPFSLYLAGFRNFIAIIGVVGAVAVGIDSAFILAAYNRMRSRTVRRPGPAAYLFEVGLWILIAAGIAAYLYQLSAY